MPPDFARHAAWHPLEDRLRCYEQRGDACRKRNLIAKVGQIVLGAGIPLLSAVRWWTPPSNKLVSAPLSARRPRRPRGCCSFSSGMRCGLPCRGTAERLQRERWLLLARAEAYASLSGEAALVRLAGRVEALLAPEHESWLDVLGRPVARADGARPALAIRTSCRPASARVCR